MPAHPAIRGDRSVVTTLTTLVREGEWTMEFAQALAEHLKTIEDRDLEGFLATVRQDATLILPNGRLLTGKESIGEFHRDWFGDPDWSLHAETVRLESLGDSGFALLSVRYDDIDPEGRPVQRDYHLSLLFARTDGRWLLVHDQNTFL
jgi:uncharacterized protein (TIGR02246 family)